MPSQKCPSTRGFKANLHGATYSLQVPFASLLPEGLLVYSVHILGTYHRICKRTTSEEVVLRFGGSYLGPVLGVLLLFQSLVVTSRLPTRLGL